MAASDCYQRIIAGSKLFVIMPDLYANNVFEVINENRQLTLNNVILVSQFFHNKGLYHKETSPLICRANKWTGFYTIGTSVTKELI